MGWDVSFIATLSIYASMLFAFEMNAPVLHGISAREGDGNNSCQASVPVKAGGAVLVVFWQLSPSPCQSNAVGASPHSSSSTLWSSAADPSSSGLPKGSLPALWAVFSALHTEPLNLDSFY